MVSLKGCRSELEAMTHVPQQRIQEILFAVKLTGHSNDGLSVKETHK